MIPFYKERSKYGVIIIIFVGFLLVHSVYQYSNSEVKYSDHITIKTNLVEENDYSQREYVLHNNYHNVTKYSCRKIVLLKTIFEWNL